MPGYKTFGIALGTAFLLFVSGCAGKVQKISGVVRLEGKPLAGAMVQFWPKEDLRLGSFGAVTNKDGQFEIVPERGGMTGKPGLYVVLITRANLSFGAPSTKKGAALPVGGVPGQGESGIPAEYGDKKASPFTVKIREGENNFPPFELKKQNKH